MTQEAAVGGGGAKLGSMRVKGVGVNGAKILCTDCTHKHMPSEESET